MGLQSGKYCDTQVAEMSLDLSATLLVSQIADPAGLIQRLGRLNRRYCGHSLDALFYPDEKVGYPYKEKQLILFYNMANRESTIRI